MVNNRKQGIIQLKLLHTKTYLRAVGLGLHADEANQGLHRTMRPHNWVAGRFTETWEAVKALQCAIKNKKIWQSNKIINKILNTAKNNLRHTWWASVCRAMTSSWPVGHRLWTFVQTARIQFCLHWLRACKVYWEYPARRSPKIIRKLVWNSKFFNRFLCKLLLDAL